MMGAGGGPDLLEALLRRDRAVVIGAVILVCLVAGSYTVFGVGMGMTAIEMTPNPFAHAPGEMSGDMGAGMAGGGQAHRMKASASTMAMPMGEGGSMAMTSMTPTWTATYALLMLAMWWFMMIAMMLPSATPTVLLAASINRRAQSKVRPFGHAGFFVVGYLLAWLGFSAVATTLQWALQALGHLSPMMASSSPYLSAALLIVAGAWQFTPIKQACLRHCRSPLDLIFRQRGQGNLGALRTGLGHGAYCLGCCWFLMALLFVGGVMNLFWIVGLAVYVMLEKMAPGGELMSRLIGAGLIVAGLVLALR